MDTMTLATAAIRVPWAGIFSRRAESISAECAQGSDGAAVKATLASNRTSP